MSAIVAGKDAEETDPMEPMKPMEPMQPMDKMARDNAWWHGDLGDPSVTGSSNDIRYAYFADKHRLAVQQKGLVRLYDTGGARLSGFNSRSDGRLRFASDTGPGELKSLKQVKD